MKRFKSWLAGVWVRVKEQPAAVLQLLQAFIGMAVALGWVTLTEDQTGGVLASATAMLNLAIALSVRQFAWPLVTTLVQAAAPAGVAFGWWNIDPQALATVYAFVALLGVVLLPTRLNPETKLLPARMRADMERRGLDEVQVRYGPTGAFHQYRGGIVDLEDELPRSGAVSRYPDPPGSEKRRDPGLS